MILHLHYTLHDKNYMETLHHATSAPQAGDRLRLFHSADGQTATLTFDVLPQSRTWEASRAPFGEELPTTISIQLGEPCLVQHDS